MDRTAVGRATSAPRPRRLALATVLLAGAIVSPLARPRGWDDFPISSYPMFSRGDVGSINALAQVLVVHADGARTPAAPALVGTPEPMIAMALVRGHVDRGTAAELCAEVAARARVAAVDAVAVEVVTSIFDTRRYFSGSAYARTPFRRDVHARCEVPR